MSKEKMQEARRLIQERNYDRARVILESVDHPLAREWLAKLDTIAPKTSQQTKSSQTRSRIPILLILLVGLVLVVVVLAAVVFLGGSEDSTPTADGVADSTQQADEATDIPEDADEATDIPENVDSSGGSTDGSEFSASSELVLGSVTIVVQHPEGWVSTTEDDGETALGSTSHAIDSIKLNPGSPLATFADGEAALEISVLDTEQFGVTDPVRILETSLSFITNSPDVTSSTPESITIADNSGARATLTTPTYDGVVYVIQPASDVFLYIRAGGADNSEAVITAIIESIRVK